VAVFKFRLASVLLYRERVKQEKQSEIDALIGARRRIEDEINALDHCLLSAAAAIAGKEGQIISARQLQLYGSYANEVTQRIREKQGALNKCEEDIVLKRQELIEATRAVKALEQLRARLEERFLRERNREEQKFADEIGRRKFANPDTWKKIPH
jgi:flagellar export protein FliJ